MKGSALASVFVALLTPVVLFAVIVVASGSPLVAWQPPVLWSHMFGGSYGSNGAASIASDSSGIYVEGYLNDSGIGYGSGSLYLDKYDFDGKTVWSRTVGDTNETLIESMSVGSEGIYLGEAILSRNAVVKYDLAGNEVWIRDLKTASEQIISSAEIRSVSVDPSGVYVSGLTQSNLPNTTYAVPTVSIRGFDLNGSIIWTNVFYYNAVSVGVYAANLGVYVAAELYGFSPQSVLTKYDANGNQIWTRDLPDGGSAISGDSSGMYVSGSSLYKYDSTGNLAWAAQINLPDGSQVAESSLAVDSSGIYVSAYGYLGNTYLLKYDLSGGQIWSLRLSTHGAGFNLYQLAAGSGGIYLAGSQRSNYKLSALIEKVGPSASLILFGVNPPWSLIALAGMVGGSATIVFVFRKRQKKRPGQHGRVKPSLAVTD